MIKIRYDIEKATSAGVKLHPQMVMMNLGYKAIKFKADRENDCWFFEVVEVIEPLPVYLEEV